MPNKKFLEEYPLYKECDAEDSLIVDRASLVSAPMGYGQTSVRKYIAKPSINGECPICKQTQTFNMMGEYGDGEYLPAGHIFHITYKCAGCNYGGKHFFVYFFKKPKNKKGEERLFMMKVGQYPAWGIEIDKNLEKLLGDKKEIYKRGLICESQSYGIGAYAYYRRIAEDIIDELLKSIYDLIEEKDKEKYKQALESVSKTKNASEKIELVKDLLPQSLRPDGLNPLGVLHSALSAGLHKESDEECLEKADDIKQVMNFLVNQIVRHNEGVKQFTSGMKKLLDKNNNKAKKIKL